MGAGVARIGHAESSLAMGDAAWSHTSAPRFAGIPVIRNRHIFPGRIVVEDENEYRRTFMGAYSSQGDPMTPEECTAQEIADRLLGTTHRLTLDMMQRAVDLITHDHHRPMQIFLSPEMYRQYLHLLDADRYTKSP